MVIGMNPKMEIELTNLKLTNKIYYFFTFRIISYSILRNFGIKCVQWRGIDSQSRSTKI